MRIVVDGAHGAGKSTFLNGIKPLRKDDRFFTDLIGTSFLIGVTKGVVPAKNNEDWNALFEIIVNRGIDQFNQAAENSYNWYERGIHFAEVISKMDGTPFPGLLLPRINEKVYDYAFVFEPIETIDFSNVHRFEGRSFSLEDRWKCVDITTSVYQSLGCKTCRVP